MQLSYWELKIGLQSGFYGKWVIMKTHKDTDNFLVIVKYLIG
jgi:hypothetical protein